ncbi:HAD family hydrolase [Prochlorothrix hollandica]|uniref:Hydrolase n=1 Tax=Prochlorothrix hollandica PCC 9006 = CALU 1027 TaxID=317619 RepID=A0A0M2Q2Q2_PROHO|nr:HAD-IA family hydrolase [Prochlorothrix hollandica]KKJ01249.1 hypothetical protein PROH_02445 [Prochlorothrix hollandica PCC 9006 = CALU 1027]
MKTTILFDLDGTLANTDPLHYQIWAELLPELGRTLTPDFYQHHISGRQNRCLLADLFPDWPLAVVDQFADRKEALFRERAAAKLEPLPGLLPFLDWIKGRGLICGVVTNAPRLNAFFMLETLDLVRWFDTIVIAEEAAAPKPDPAPYCWALERLGRGATTAIAFEDSAPGIRSATGAGIYTVGLTTTHGAADLRSAGAREVCADFSGVLGLEVFRDRA